MTNDVYTMTNCRILIVKLSSLGDLFHALPAVRGLKQGLEAEVDWVTHSGYVDLVRCFDDVSRAIPFHRNAFFRNMGSFLRDLRRDRYDIVVDLQGLLKSAIVCKLARGDAAIGPGFAREGARFLYDGLAGKPDRTRHAVEQNMDVLPYLGLARPEPAFPVHFPPLAADRLQALGPRPRPRVALIPCSRWTSKNWPAESFVAIGRRLRERHQARIVLLGGPEDVSVCAAIADGIGAGALDLAGKTSLVEMGSVLREMDVAIGNDSGPAHLAVAAGTPTLALFGPTDPARTGAYGALHRNIRADLTCAGCYARSCPKPGLPCMAGISVDQVLQTASRLLDETQ